MMPSPSPSLADALARLELLDVVAHPDTVAEIEFNDLVETL